MSKSIRQDFPAGVVRKVAERATYICSNPSCHRITIGPDQALPNSSIKTGEAAHICAASPGGPRYDMSQSEQERKGISNAIWLCGACADLVDKNQGKSYPADYLRKWKHDHEALMKECLEGGKRLVFQFLPHRHDMPLARRVVSILEDKSALYQPYAQEDPRRVLNSLKDLRTSLTAIRAEIDPESPLSVITESLIRACRHYMNTTPDNPRTDELNFSLGAVRKIVGINVGDLLRHYKIPVSHELSSIIPK
ncbi:hypothetical protein [Xylophilus sp. Leaf220]|uniref:hypothetical protein n=1 Tax=Xylophilus sp. Leaf220 TaxID=1735686 RepID=UPI0009EC4D5F|nr:hypothetical protein [Xylophilus sp. Leaf220]